MSRVFKGRREDQRLITGQGRFTGDWNLPGQVNLLRYTGVDDCGRIINHTLLEGQIHGGDRRAAPARHPSPGLPVLAGPRLGGDRCG